MRVRVDKAGRWFELFVRFLGCYSCAGGSEASGVLYRWGHDTLKLGGSRGLWCMRPAASLVSWGSLATLGSGVYGVPFGSRLRFHSLSA
jgi:hypothetical protein